MAKEYLAHPWQMGFMDAASPLMAEISKMHNFLLVIITVIAIFVVALIVYVLWRFRAKKNPLPTGTTHNVPLEIVWTAIPALIVALIAIPSVKLIHKAETIPEPEMTLKATGHQWYWSYEYPKEQIEYESRILLGKDLPKDGKRLLEVDNRVVVPADTVVKIIVSSQDVLHSFAVPAVGIKRDAVPGRLTETWAMFKPGVYYGQCSEICGHMHGFMPIVIEAVSKAEYQQWVKREKEK